MIVAAILAIAAWFMPTRPRIERSSEREGEPRVERVDEIAQFDSVAAPLREVDAPHPNAVSQAICAPREVLRGRLVDCTSMPLTGVEVLGRRGESVTTDEFGFFELPGPSRGQPRLLMVNADSLPDGVAAPYWQTMPRNRFAGTAGLLRPSRSGSAEVPVFELGLTGEVTGRIALESGEPYTGTVSMRGWHGAGTSPSGPNYVFETDEDGRFLLEDVASGQYRITIFDVSRSRVRPQFPLINISCLPETDLRLFPLPEGRGVLGLQAVDQYGEPVAELGFGLWERRGPVDRMPAYHAIACGSTGADGVLVFEGVPDGDYLLIRTQSGRPDRGVLYRDHRPGPVLCEFLEGLGPEPIEWKLTVARPGSVVGELVPRREGPAFAVKLTEVARGGRSTFAIVDENGTFRFAGVLPGEVEVMIRRMTATVECDSLSEVFESGQLIWSTIASVAEAEELTLAVNVD